MYEKNFGNEWINFSVDLSVLQTCMLNFLFFFYAKLRIYRII